MIVQQLLVVVSIVAVQIVGRPFVQLVELYTVVEFAEHNFVELVRHNAVEPDGHNVVEPVE